VILGFHFIFSAYGFWLPNDPRGSWSEAVRQFEIARYGPATKVDTRRSVADRPHDWSRRWQAKRALRYPAVRFTGEQARCIARGFAAATREATYRVHGLVVLPMHTHLVMARHDHDKDRIAGRLKGHATMQLNAHGLHPLAQYRSTKTGRIPSPWARNHWCVFIDSAEQMCTAINYVIRNPDRENLPRQRWSLITPYPGITYP